MSVPSPNWGRILLGALIALGILAALLAGGYFAKQQIEIARAPVYTWTQTPSTLRADFMSSTLASAENVYVSDLPEYNLLIDSSFYFSIVGRTADGLLLYAIPHQEPSDYVALTGFMFPSTVFRNRSTPPFDWRQAEFKEMRLLPGEANAQPQKSADPALVGEALAAMKGSFGPALTLKDPTSRDLRLVSSQLPGLLYCAKVYTDSDGQVYLAENSLTDQWFPAGPLFATWVSAHG